MFSVFLEEGANPAMTPELWVARSDSDPMRVCLGDAASSWALFLDLLLALGVNVNESLHLLVLSFPGPHQEKGFSCLHQVV